MKKLVALATALTTVALTAASVFVVPTSAGGDFTNKTLQIEPASFLKDGGSVVLDENGQPVNYDYDNNILYIPTGASRDLTVGVYVYGDKNSQYGTTGWDLSVYNTFGISAKSVGSVEGAVNLFGLNNGNKAVKNNTPEDGKLTLDYEPDNGFYKSEKESVRSIGALDKNNDGSAPHASSPKQARDGADAVFNDDNKGGRYLSLFTINYDLTGVANGTYSVAFNEDGVDGAGNKMYPFAMVTNSGPENQAYETRDANPKVALNGLTVVVGQSKPAPAAATILKVGDKEVVIDKADIGSNKTLSYTLPVTISGDKGLAVFGSFSGLSITGPKDAVTLDQHVFIDPATDSEAENLPIKNSDDPLIAAPDREPFKHGAAVQNEGFGYGFILDYGDTRTKDTLPNGTVFLYVDVIVDLSKLTEADFTADGKASFVVNLVDGRDTRNKPYEVDFFNEYGSTTDYTGDPAYPFTLVNGLITLSYTPTTPLPPTTSTTNRVPSGGTINPSTPGSQAPATGSNGIVPTIAVLTLVGAAAIVARKRFGK